MITKIFTIYDSKVGAYLTPVHYRSRGEAIRSVSEALLDPNHQFTKHSGDYTLFELGEWDDNSAVYTLNPTPVSLGVLIEFKGAA